jgi:hypothetical protein
LFSGVAYFICYLEISISFAVEKGRGEHFDFRVTSKLTVSQNLLSMKNKEGRGD